MYEKIIVPLDGSTNAEIVIPYVQLMALSFSTEIVMVSVADARLEGVDQMHEAYLNRETQLFKQMLDEGCNPRKSCVSYQVLKGKPADEIVAQANKLNADLIIIASRGSSGQQPPLLGNVSAKILWSTRRPTLLIRSPLDIEAYEDNRMIKRILVPLDGSPAGEAAIEYVTTFAKAVGAEVVLFQVVEPFKAFVGYETLSSIPLPSREDVRAAAIAYLTTVQTGIKKDDLKISIEAYMGTAAEGIIDYAEKSNIDLIALSAHGQSNIGRWVFGSVTEKVMHSGTKPLLIVHRSR
jgi:nucleotide-binding universal stress UspA family protein